MASIFTYEPDIPRVSSPWLKQFESTNSSEDRGLSNQLITEAEPTVFLNDKGHVMRLQAEPQEGPVEYKLHLLLRSRRNYASMSTVTQISGSRHSKYNGPPRTGSETLLQTSAASPASMQPTRQHRLEQLTTQLLWRLKQSSPHHSSSDTTLVLPHLPESSTELQAPPQPAKLLHGLEESQGALYEIGVSDDGTLVGLAEDEMQESLNNLRAMAASLGCVVDVQRMVKVGRCNWTEHHGEDHSTQHDGDLFVAEALVKPNLVLEAERECSNLELNALEQSYVEKKPARQLRISLTGATMSGKSSLLGALSTTTLDNGRGKSRLSMLKHRHEITSGVTSSVTQELIGYSDMPDGRIKVINYATEGVTSWIDMHSASAEGRLIFISDSAGHPRYRRTTVRGLVGWNPHWALLCIPADDEGESSGKVGSTPPSSEVLGPSAGDVDLSAAHLDLCLRLHLPLVVVITKLDLASKTGLRATLAKLLSILKAAGRKPTIIPNSPGAVAEDELQTFTEKKLSDIRKTLHGLADDPLSAVPIVMTSAVHGAGFDNLHAILHELPIPERASQLSTEVDGRPHSVFHIEDTYTKAMESNIVIISGHVGRGAISIGEELYLGPCTYSVAEDSEDSDTQTRPRYDGAMQTSRSFPGALKTPNHVLLPHKRFDQEWRRVKIVSIRNLRLPVTTLLADQAGTIGLELAENKNVDSLAAVKIRRGTVLCNIPVSATSTLVAQFRREDLGSLAVGSQVVLYLASVRSSARILSCRIPEPSELRTESLEEADVSSSGDGLASYQHDGAGAITHRFLQVTFSFDSSKEYVEAGTKILVMPGGGPGLFGGTERGEKGVAGLEGFVGSIVEVFG